jgi:hypothetical protein
MNGRVLITRSLLVLDRPVRRRAVDQDEDGGSVRKDDLRRVVAERQVLDGRSSREGRDPEDLALAVLGLHRERERP